MGWVRFIAAVVWGHPFTGQEVEERMGTFSATGRVDSLVYGRPRHGQGEIDEVKVELKEIKADIKTLLLTQAPQRPSTAKS